ncbi:MULTISPECIES: hypothetical protein [unclassified Gemella]|uniref:hypothetical protein n=1 Tax=unclassified Gemella TaxID=2624949 RepID=UPI0010749543|nr:MULTISPECIES: hypothetical protein [unclassified Gemella]MBF0709767.1 hypothetical protein [Gemella sp. GL1.1]NYS27111.1 hypothetical protein [Gemella sp. GL1]TFU58385.1 hypothetical protein E4T67_05720 [Gemella sp. WT2a]
MKKKIQKIIKRNSNNKGSALVISLSMLLLVITVIFSISNIYMNKIQSIKNINTYYDRKINEALEERDDNHRKEIQENIEKKYKEDNKKIQMENRNKALENLEKEKVEFLEKIKLDKEKFDQEIEKKLNKEA